MKQFLKIEIDYILLKDNSRKNIMILLYFNNFD